jgi:tetratricopeptide (TPR) repeat protein
MATIQEVRIPDLGDFDEVEIVEVMVSAGDEVAAEDPLITLETDKAAMEVPSPLAGSVVEVLVATGRIDELESALKQNLSIERFVGYSWARLAELHTQRRELEPALAAGLKALDEGIVDPGLTSLCAQLLEQAERFDEAEALLMRMPGGGCGGGAHPLLAEFWLRRGQNFDQALESFKGAMRQERDNPRWLLRISQVYMAKGWRKEASEQIERLMSQGDLPDQIRTEVKAVADQLQQQ